MPFADLREWLSALEKAGELQRIGIEVDWDLEAGAIVRRICETDGPAVLFEKIKDYPKGFRLLGAPMAPTCCSTGPGRRNCCPTKYLKYLRLITFGPKRLEKKF